MEEEEKEVDDSVRVSDLKDIRALMESLDRRMDETAKIGKETTERLRNIADESSRLEKDRKYRHAGSFSMITFIRIQEDRDSSSMAVLLVPDDEIDPSQRELLERVSNKTSLAVSPDDAEAISEACAGWSGHVPRSTNGCLYIAGLVHYYVYMAMDLDDRTTKPIAKVLQ